MEAILSALIVTQWLKTLWASQTYSSKSSPSTTTLHAVLSQGLTQPRQHLDLPHGLTATEASEAVKQRVSITGLNQSWGPWNELLK
jgi:hypothetical protein